MKEDLINLKNQAIAQITDVKDLKELEQIRIDLFGRSGKFTLSSKEIAKVPNEEKKQFGITLNEVKNTLEELIAEKKNELKTEARVWFDPTMPAKKTELGHLHMVTRAIDEIASVFEKIGFSGVRFFTIVENSGIDRWPLSMIFLPMPFNNTEHISVHAHRHQWVNTAFMFYMKVANTYFITFFKF